MKWFIWGLGLGVFLTLVLTTARSPEVLVVDHGPMWIESNDCRTVFLPLPQPGYYNFQIFCTQRPTKLDRWWNIEGEFVIDEEIPKPGPLKIDFDPPASTVTWSDNVVYVSNNP